MPADEIAMKRLLSQMAGQVNEALNVLSALLKREAQNYDSVLKQYREDLEVHQSMDGNLHEVEVPQIGYVCYAVLNKRANEEAAELEDLQEIAADLRAAGEI